MQSSNNQPYIIAIDGPIGVGKSTAIETVRASLGNTPNIIFLTEPVTDWAKLVDVHGKTLLERYYANPTAHVFALQTIVFVSMHSQLATAIYNNPQCAVIVQERSAQASVYVFARMMLENGTFAPDQHDIYISICQQCIAAAPLGTHIDEVIYLHASTNICLARIAARARPGEQQIAHEYLEECEQAYTNWLSHPNAPIPYILNAERSPEKVHAQLERILYDTLFSLRPDLFTA